MIFSKVETLGNKFRKLIWKWKSGQLIKLDINYLEKDKNVIFINEG